MRAFIGPFGHLMVIIAFVAALVAAFSYWYQSKQQDRFAQASYLRFARVAFGVHALAVLGTIISLFIIIYNHYYEYHYAWSHSSNNLPVHYMISCFWEGQEGSFLLWIFWHVLIGSILMFNAKSWEGSVMTVFALVQAFLVSMILGVVIPGLDIKIGSDPFALLRNVMDAPIFATNPDFVPEDGTGLNPLLQNYWMVIHPPTLFLGFAGTLVPFAFCIAGLRNKMYKEWVKPALPWAQLTAVVLGIGIMMGAYWAYETLNFGGYWNWDPVENAVYIPWLVLVAAIHVMITFRKKDTALKASMILVIASFILVLYATFLTRSGVLGESSVHSFTDLGLSGQLLVYLFAFLGIAIAYLVRAWKDLPSTSEEISTYSREFWIFMGATTLCLAAFQVVLPTSIPVFNSIIEAFGGTSDMAPPADQVAFYTKFQLWFGVAIALLSGTGQFFWWKKMDAQKLKSALTIPLIITLLLTSAIIVGGNVTQPSYIVLLLAAIYSVVSNTSILIRLGKSNIKLSGGAVTHIGVALMLIGILFSSGYSRVISLNTSGMLYNKEFSDEMNRENLLLFRGQPEKMNDYTLVYEGQYMESEDVPGYIDKEDLIFLNDPYKAIAKKDLAHKGTTYANAGDTIQLYNENTYFRIGYTREDGQQFTLYPRIQDNPQMGLVPSPDISNFWDRDLYTHITNMADPEAEAKWNEAESFTLAMGDTFYVNDFVAVLDKVYRVEDVPGVTLNQGDVAVKANIRVLGNLRDYDLQPIFLVKDQSVGMVPDQSADIGVRATFENISPEDGTFTFSIETSQRDWIIMKAVEMPFINILWIGTIIMSIGFGIAVYRRFGEFRKSERDKQGKSRAETTRPKKRQKAEKPA